MDHPMAYNVKTFIAQSPHKQAIVLLNKLPTVSVEEHAEIVPFRLELLNTVVTRQTS